jgi:hypothetical protein
MTAEEYLKENSDWFYKSPGGENLYFESEVIKMMKNYSSQQEISDEEIKEIANESKSIFKEDMYRTYFIMGAKWYREHLKTLNV